MVESLDREPMVGDIFIVRDGAEWAVLKGAWRGTWTGTIGIVVKVTDSGRMRLNFITPLMYPDVDFFEVPPWSPGLEYLCHVDQ